MKKITVFLFSMLILTLSFTYAQQLSADRNLNEISSETNLLFAQDIIPPYMVPLWDSPQSIMFNQDSLITHLGQGAGGAHVSAIPTSTNTLYGWGAQGPLGYWMADDFVVPTGQTWTIDSIKLYSYQTGSTTVSTITGSKCFITLGRVDSTGSTVVAGDSVTNRMLRTYWTGIYRTNNPPPYTTQTTRPIMAVTDTINTTLVPGYYWIVYNFTGTLASGPWNPPYTIWNQIGSGNARQKTTAWAPALDGTYPQSIAVKIYGNNIVGISGNNNETPNAFSLMQNYPNPFNPSTNIRFNIPTASDVRLDVYDMTGKLVTTIVNDFRQAGSYTFGFNASDLASGVYIYKLTAGTFTESKKMLLIK